MPVRETRPSDSIMNADSENMPAVEPSTHMGVEHALSVLADILDDMIQDAQRQPAPDLASRWRVTM